MTGPSQTIGINTSVVGRYSAGDPNSIYQSSIYESAAAAYSGSNQKCACCPWWLWTLMGMITIGAIGAIAYAMNPVPKRI